MSKPAQHTLYAILQTPIGRIHGWAIPDHIACHSPVLHRLDLATYGVSITKDGKRIPPPQFYADLGQDEAGLKNPPRNI